MQRVDFRDKCGDCAVEVDEFHQLGCDVARCGNCGGQALGCGCGDDEFINTRWSGFWPGDLEAAMMGLWAYFGPDYGERGWISCDESDQRGRPDLNTYYSITWFDPSKGRPVRI